MSGRGWSKEDETALLLTKVTHCSLRQWALDHKRSPLAVRLKLMRLRRNPALKPPEFSPANASSAPASRAAASPQAPAGRGPAGRI